MKTQHLFLQFHTPAFLGDAEQNGRWRTPPFKAQLRQWWRVAYAAAHNFQVDLAAMRREEGLLFGNAWLDGEFCKSLVRLRLSRWEEGRLKSWQGLEQGTVFHPEVHRTGCKVGPHAYLGYGPLDGRGNTKFSEKVNAAIQAVDEEATLELAYPENLANRIERALWLMHQYGTVGGRSRNGWGSYELSPLPPGEGQGVRVPLREWKACLALDWPHAIGQDEKGALIWQTAPHDDWKALMKTLAALKIGLRTQFRFTTGRGAPQPEARHWLSYPVTNHSVQPWGNNARLPNQLRFKVRRNSDGKLIGVIFHMPHLPPPAFNPDRQAIVAVWTQVHRFLDNPAQQLKRIEQ